MKNNDLLIRQVIFDLTLNKEDQYSSLNDTIVAFVNDRFERIYQRVAQEFDPNQNIFIDKLEINLSEYDLFDLEHTEHLLFEKSVAYIQKVSDKSSSRILFTEKTYTLLKLFNFIARYGFLPWRFNQKKNIQQFFEEEIDKTLHREALLSLLGRDQISFSRIARVLETKRFQKLLKILLAEDYPLYQELIQIENQLKTVRKEQISPVSFYDAAFYFLQQTSRSGRLRAAAVIKTITFIEKKYALNQEETKTLFQAKGLNKWMNKEALKKEVLISPRETLFKDSSPLKQLVELFVEVEKKEGLKVTLQDFDYTTTLFQNKEVLEADLDTQIKNLIQVYVKQGYSITAVSEIIYQHLINKTSLNLTEKKVFIILGNQYNFRKTLSKEKESQFQTLAGSYSLHFSSLTSRDWIELKHLFVKIEEKGLLKKTTLQDSKTNVFGLLAKKNQVVSIKKTLHLITQFYKNQFHYSFSKVIKVLYSFLIQKKKNTPLEISLLTGIGVLVFVELKLKSMRNETVFINSIRAIGKSKNQKHEKTYYKLKSILSRPKLDEHLEFIQGLYFKMLSSNINNSEYYTFKTILLSLEDVDNEALPFSVDALEEQNFKKIERKLEAKQNTHPNPAVLDVEEEYFDFVLNLNNELYKKAELKVSSDEKIFISIKSILKSTSNLFSFLSAYEEQDRLLSNFSQLTITNKFDAIFKSLLKNNYSDWIQVEAKLIALQTEFYLVDIEINRFKSVLRHFLVKSLIDSEKKWSPGTFTYTFLSFIQTQSRVHLNKIKAYSQEHISEFIPDIIIGFEVFSSTNPFEKVPVNKRKKWYYKGLFFYYLKFKKIPFWADTKKILDFELEQFISLLCEQKDGAFLKTMLNDTDVRTSLLSVIKKQSASLHKKFLIELVEKENQKKFKFFLDQEFKWIKDEGIPSFKLVESLISTGFWNFKSIQVFVEEIVKKFKKEFPLRKDVSKGLNTLFLEKIELPMISNTKELLLYFLDTKKFPKTLNKENKTIIPTLQKELYNNPSLTFTLFSNLLQKAPASNDERLVIFNRKSVIKAVMFRFNKKSLATNLLLPFLEEIERQIVEESSFFECMQILLGHLVETKEDIRLAITLTLHHLLSSKKNLYRKMIKALDGNSNFKLWMTTKSIEKAKKAKTIQNNFSSLVNYIEIGSLPVHQLNVSPAQLSKFLEQAPLLMVQKHLYLWANEQEKQERFLKLFEPKSRLANVLKYVQPELAALIVEAAQIFNRETLNPKSVPKIHLQKTYSQAILSLWALQNFKMASPYPLLSAFIKTELTQDGLLLTRFLKTLDNTPDLKTKIDKQKLRKHLLPKKAEKIEPQYEILPEEPLKKEELKKGITIENAGLVIAWPFLSTLFSKMGLVENNKIKNEVSMQKAILATQYLVYGTKEVEETQLVLNKILCGADIDFYVDVEILLDEIEIGICDMALKSILGQWGKIKSVGALREFFFQRTGLIQSQEESTFTLIVEKETRDILLRFIPWNLSVIKTTLMQNKLIIDWKY